MHFEKHYILAEKSLREKIRRMTGLYQVGDKIGRMKNKN